MSSKKNFGYHQSRYLRSKYCSTNQLMPCIQDTAIHVSTQLLTSHGVHHKHPNNNAANEERPHNL